MQRVWAAVVAVWATLALVAVLAWSRPPASPSPQAAGTIVVVKSKGGAVRQLVTAAPHATTRTSPPPP